MSSNIKEFQVMSGNLSNVREFQVMSGNFN